MPPKGSGVAAKRCAKELIEVQKELPEGIRAGLKNPDNLFEWYAQIDGPSESIYDGGVFDIDIVIPTDYPFRPPRAQFRTKVYHMNINAQGGICLDILKNQWSPALSVTKVCLSILSLLTDPNPNDPLVGEIASLYRRDKTTHDRNARDWTVMYAKPEFAKPPVPPRASTSSAMSASANAAATGGKGSASTAAASSKGKNPPTGKPTVIDIDDDDDVIAPIDNGAAAMSRNSSSNKSSQDRKRKSEDTAASGESSRASSRPRLAGTTSANNVIELD